MGKYDPLRSHLASQPKHVLKIVIDFVDIEQLVGELPKSARSRRAWWEEMIRASNQVMAQSWRIESFDRVSEKVTFARRIKDVAGPDDGHADGYEETGDSAERTQHSGSGRVRTVGFQAIATDATAALIAVAATIASDLIGFAHLPWPALLLLSVVVAIAFWAMTQAVQSREHESVSRWWAVSVLALLLIIGGSFAYHRLLDPTTRARHTYQLIVNGSEVDVIPLFGEAGGPEQHLATGSTGQNGLIGGQSYSFDCWVVGPDGKEWLRYERYGQAWWAPRKYLHPPFGERAPTVPHC